MGQSELMNSYNKLMEKRKEQLILTSVEALAQWDMETKMPPGGINLRSQQQGLLSQLDHRIATDPMVGALLEGIEKDPQLGGMTELQRRNIYLVRKDYNEQTRLPEQLVAETEKQKVVAYGVWKRAKATKDFGLFRPELEKLFELKKQSAELLMDVKGAKTIYDALIDYFEPKMNEEAITNAFDDLRKGLIPIISKCINSSSQPDRSILKRPVPIASQLELSRSIADFIGYDIASEKARGRIDETEHPFTTGYYDDVRITTHYYENDFTSSLFSVLHEGGHALYEQNLNPEWIYQPAGAACSYGFHESQSRFVENIVGRSPEFWAYFLPVLKKIAAPALSDLEPNQFIRAINAVKPSKIRIEADEATYSLHIIIRFELERDLFAGKVKVGELPQLWNQKYKEYLDVDIKDDAEGVLQDVHWSEGYFGYFPSYALGNIYGGQILHRMRDEIPLCCEAITKEVFGEIREWLVRNVQSLGNLYDPLVLLKRITGEEINSRHFLEYLDGKYSELYGY